MGWLGPHHNIRRRWGDTPGLPCPPCVTPIRCCCAKLTRSKTKPSGSEDPILPSRCNTGATHISSTVCLLKGLLSSSCGARGPPRPRPCSLPPQPLTPRLPPQPCTATGSRPGGHRRQQQGPAAAGCAWLALLPGAPASRACYWVGSSLRHVEHELARHCGREGGREGGRGSTACQCQCQWQGARSGG